MVAITQNFSIPYAQGEGRADDAAYTKVPLVERTAQTTLGRVREPSGTKISSKMVTALTVTDLSASLTRHILQATPSVGPKHPSVSGLDCVSSGIGVLLGSAVTVGNGIAEFHKSHMIQDGEGMRRSGSQILSGVIATNASALSLAHETTAASIASVGAAADVLCGVGSLVSLGISGWGIYRCARFRTTIDGHMNTKHLSERDRVVKTLQFLKEKIVPTAKEFAKIESEVNALYPKWGEKARAHEVKKRFHNLGETKFRYFKRRTNQETAARVLQEIDSHLARLTSPNPHPKAVEEAKGLIAEVKKKNLAKMLLKGVIAVASLIAFTALILGTFYSLGALPFVLYAISSGIALAILLYPLIVENLGRSKSAAMQSRAMALAPTVVANATPG